MFSFDITFILDNTLDLIDHLMPGLINYLKSFYKSYLSVKWVYSVFTLMYLLYIYIFLGKTTVESSIYVKFAAVLLNIALLFYYDNKPAKNDSDCNSRFD